MKSCRSVVIWVKCRAMKRACLAIACCLCVAADTQPPVVSLQVKTLATKKEVGENWHSDYGSSNTERARSVVIEINLRNMKNEKAQVLLEWYFIASGTKNAQWVFDSDSEDVNINGLETLKLEKESTQLDHAKMNLAAIGVKRESGGKPAGWIVRVKSGEKVIAVQASTAPLAVIAKDQKKLDALSEMDEQ